MKKSKKNITKLNEGIDLIERRMDKQWKQHEKLFAAEVKSRLLLFCLCACHSVLNHFISCVLSSCCLYSCIHYFCEFFCSWVID